MPGFILKELRIYRNSSYLDETRALRGKVEFEGEHGETALNLNEWLSKRIVELCAQEIADSASEIADNMRADALSVAAIAAPARDGS